MNGEICFFDEIIVDNFAGGGGASTGIELATGRVVDTAINHDPDAILMHKTNHPHTEHIQASVWDVDPVEVCRGRPVGLAWFSPDCFVEGTLVLTEDGYRPIEQIRVGDMVWTHKGRWRPVTETMQSKKSVMLIRGYGHPGIICSIKHPFYITQRNGEPRFAEARDIDPKTDYWGCPVEAGDFDYTETDETMLSKLWLAGRYIGDGWLRMDGRHRETVITCGTHDADELEERLREIGDTLSIKFSRRKVRTGAQFTVCNKELTEWLFRWFGRLSEGKHIPTWLMAAPKQCVEAFLDGYISADGHKVITKTGAKLIECSTVSKALAYGLVHLAARIGKSATVYRSEQTNSVIEGRTVNTKPVFKVKWREKVADGHAQTFVRNGILWRPIREAIDLKNEMTVYNIGVEEDESYIAEGIIVHNCKHFSKAKGAALVDKKIRGLAWIVLRWAGTVRPRVIILENVEEFVTWGPVRKGKPVKKKAGQTFRKWKGQLQDLGYHVEHRELVAADYGAPTIRKRFVLIARCDGLPIVWPERTHAPADSEEVRSGKCKPWRSAAEIIDWSLPMYSIFDSKAEIKEKHGVNAVRPLADNTMRRIIRGVDKFTLRSGNPFLVPTGYGERKGQAPRVNDIRRPLNTVVGREKHNLCQAEMSPFLAECNHSGPGHIAGTGEPLGTITAKCTKGVAASVLAPVTFSNTSGSVGFRADKPVHTITTDGKQVLQAAQLIQYHSEQTENVRAAGLRLPMQTIDSSNRYGLVSANLTEYFGNGAPLDLREPMHTVTSHDREALTAAHICKYYGGVIGSEAKDPLPTVTGIDHNALCASHIVKFKGKNLGQDMTEPLQTITAQSIPFAVCHTVIRSYNPEEDLGRWPQVRALLNRYCGYSLAENEIILLLIGDTAYYIRDILLRMLAPKELYAAMGFPPDYIIDRDYLGNEYGKSKQVARCGNAVCPPMAEAVVRANYAAAEVTIVSMRQFERLVSSA